ncbi:MAG TPA: GvpL/GvpF family gas vesicle protein [Amycolatopsis sp.]|nr:GvpL/GvpF family gas vesicle protein [Amycolatopsis sp.]
MPETGTDNAVYVYGIVPADVESEPDTHGVGDPPQLVKTVRRGDLAALVSSITTDSPLGRPEDLAAHAAVLDRTAAVAPVLPLRFGAVVTDERSVAEELLATHHDEFAEALGELAGKAEYVLKGRYVEEEILNEILAENSELSQLREAIRDKPEDATRNERIVLGEGINNAIAAKRDADTRTMATALADVGSMLNLREPTHEVDAVHIACLVETARQADLEAAIDRVARGWTGRVEVRLLGPLAPYDFIVTHTEEQA